MQNFKHALLETYVEKGKKEIKIKSAVDVEVLVYKEEIKHTCVQIKKIIFNK